MNAAAEYVVPSPQLRETDVFPIQILEHRHLSPEETLLLAVLDDAFACLKKHVTQASTLARARHLLEEDLIWLASTEAQYTCDFVSICQTFDFDPSATREGILETLASLLAHHDKGHHHHRIFHDGERGEYTPRRGGLPAQELAAIAVRER